MKIIYACEYCHAQFDNPVDAHACEAQGVDVPIVAVGDIVLAGAGKGTWDGLDSWVANPDIVLKRSKGYAGCPNGDSNCFDSCCMYQFYYVVTHIDTENHRTRYHLATLAREEPRRGGFTYNTGHVRPVLVPDPPNAVVALSKSLIGWQFFRLL